jgi:Flp pilus assembly protein TadD
MLKGDPWGAIATLEPLMDVAPPAMELDARRTLAEAYTMAGKAERSVQLLAGRIEGNPKAAFQLAEAQYQSGDLIGAVTTIEPFAKSILESEEAPGSAVPSSMVPHILLFYGRVLSASTRHQEALPALEQASQLDPNNKQVWKTLGQALAAVGRTEEAQEALTRFREMASQETRISTEEMEEDQRDPTGRDVGRGFELLNSGQVGEALEIARQEARLAAEDPRPRLLEAMALLRLQRPEEALASAQLAVTMSPDNADAQYVRGIVRMAVNNLEGAEADLRGALDLAPAHTAAMSDLAILLISRGDEVEARQLLERLLELRPGDPVATENLARLGQN